MEAEYHTPLTNNKKSRIYGTSDLSEIYLSIY